MLILAAQLFRVPRMGLIVFNVNNPVSIYIDTHGTSKQRHGRMWRITRASHVHRYLH